MLDCEVTGSIMYLTIVSSSLPPSTHPHIHRGDVAALFKHHSAPITSVEWHPHDSTVFASAGADDQVELICVTLQAITPESCRNNIHGYSCKVYVSSLFVRYIGHMQLMENSRESSNPIYQNS